VYGSHQRGGLEALQAIGLDVGSTVASLPTPAGMVEMGRAALQAP